MRIKSKKIFHLGHFDYAPHMTLRTVMVVSFHFHILFTYLCPKLNIKSSAIFH